MSIEKSKTPIEEPQSQSQIDFKLFFKALEQKFERMESRFESVYERIERMESSSQKESINRVNDRRRERNPPRSEVEEYYREEVDEDDHSFNMGRIGHGRMDRGARYGERVDGNLGSIKTKIPFFQGKNDLEAYFKWEKIMELVFDCHNYSDLKKVKLAVLNLLTMQLFGGINLF